MSSFDLSNAVALSSAAIAAEIAEKRKANVLNENDNVENVPASKVAKTQPASVADKPSKAGDAKKTAQATKPTTTATAVAAPPVVAKVRRCFYCGQGNPSSQLHDVPMCNVCSHELHVGNFNRDKVMKFYGFSKAKADKIPRRRNYNNAVMYYTYKKATVEKAFRAEHSQKKISLAVLGTKKKYFA